MGQHTESSTFSLLISFSLDQITLWRFEMKYWIKNYFTSLKAWIWTRVQNFNFKLVSQETWLGLAVFLNFFLLFLTSLSGQMSYSQKNSKLPVREPGLVWPLFRSLAPFWISTASYSQTDSSTLVDSTQLESSKEILAQSNVEWLKCTQNSLDWRSLRTAPDCRKRLGLPRNVSLSD